MIVTSTWHMARTRILPVTAAFLIVLALSVGRASASALPHTPDQAVLPVGYVYVNDNTPGANTITGLARWADGRLTPLRGSPFAIGCCGTGAGVGSQDGLMWSNDHRFLLAVNPGSNSIAVLGVDLNGRLTPVPGSPFASGGSGPVSIAVHNQLVFVANAGVGGSNYTGFTLGVDGSLKPITGSTFAVADGASLGDVIFSADGSRLVGVRVDPSTIDSFAVDASGHLTPAPGSPFKAQGAGPFGSQFLPTGGSQLFVSNAHDGPGKGTVSAFNVAADGTLAPVAGSPYANQQTAPCWVAISPDGKLLFAANTMSDSVSTYSIDSDGGLTLIGNTTLSGGPKLGATETRVDPSGHFLYVLEGSTNALSILAINGTTLMELPNSPVTLAPPAGAKPFGLAVR
jgi:6-phosphogluconolactonase (cycloisomerase 2 family)